MDARAHAVSFRLRPRSVKWASKYLGTSEERVRKAIRSGELKFIDMGPVPGRALIQGHAWRTNVAFLDEWILGRARVMNPDPSGKNGSRSVRLKPSEILDLMERERC